jgi:hypothetical protein
MGTLKNRCCVACSAVVRIVVADTEWTVYIRVSDIGDVLMTWATPP